MSKSNLAMGFSSLCLGQICFNQGIKCDSRCRCKDCGNQPTMEDDMKENPFRIKIKVQPSAQFMVPPKVKNNEAMSPSLPGFEWHCNNAKSITSAEISDHTLNDSVDHHEERAAIAEAGEKAYQLRAKDWQKKTWKKQCKARDSLDAKEKRANEVLAALESAKRSSTATPAPVAADAGSEKPADRAPSPPAAAREGAHNQKESRDGSKGDNLLSYILAISAKPSSPDHPDHESHRMSDYDHDAAILNSETVANSASDSWKTSDDFENASISVSCWNDSPDSVSSGKKRKDRIGHPQLNQLAVNYLRSWLLSRQHIEQPYPLEQNYADLSRATGLEKPPLKNWFV